VNDGETVVAGQVIAEVQVDKVSQDLEAPVAGVMYQLVAEGVGVRQGEPVARIG
jgi:pyruvate/2-oxoglutarate dehydrogenase complex dihydrolipoamide acyltransferase (E2) component